MIIIKHRINSINQLKKINPKLGVEFDVRTFKNYFSLSHNPFKKGEFLPKYLNNYKHAFAIIDVKEEGIERKILNTIKKKINNYFFLNVSIPRIEILLKKKININLCLRLSEFENINKINFFYKKIKWIWVDTFNNKIPVNIHELKKLSNKFNLCLVSPELVPTNSIALKKFYILNKKKIKYFKAVCTKKTFFWKK